ncbi:hypothetical protein [Nonlabens antarcticus]|uniref:hypothetical protein n=1 Tax=Nonlabens antarcticus TaxID=392714 RepID=UPI0018913A7F|nr:hypothetical protein [Nonlabens antarcticus]
MKFTLCAILLGVAGCLYGQNLVDPISGSYNMGSNDPLGGTHFIVMPDQQFVVAYFGGMRKGTWERYEDTYQFTYHVEPQFVLYGRKNPSIADSIQVRVGLDGNRGFAVRFNGTKTDAFTPIFNEDSNCYSYPYIYKQTAALEQVDVYAPDLREYYEGEIHEIPDYYSFKVGATYNEFVLTGLSREYSTERSFTAQFKEGSMIINGSESIKKSGDYADLNPEDLNYFKQYTTTEIFPPQLEYGNEFFPYNDEPINDDLIPFNRIDAVLVSSDGVVVGGESFFVVRCEE